MLRTGVLAWALLVSLASASPRARDPGMARHASAVTQAFQRAQAAVMGEYQYDPHLVCASARVHGAVAKRAVGSAVPLLRQHQPSFLTLARAGVPVYAGFQVYISKRFKFIYIRQPKSSSSSLLAAIQALYCGGKVCSTDQFVQVQGSLVDDAIWRAYFVFTAVRNPIARMVSTYIMFNTYFLFQRNPDTKAKGAPCGIDFVEFTRDVYRLQAICAEQQCCAWKRAGINDWHLDFPSPHIQQQAHAIFTPAGDSVVDYIARTEHIADDWAEIVQLIALRSRKNIGTVPIMNVNGHHDEDAAVAPEDRHPCLHPDVARRRLLNATTQLQLVRQFAMDFHLLGYLPERTDAAQEN